MSTQSETPTIAAKDLKPQVPPDREYTLAPE